MANYIALLRKEEDSDFGVSFRDFPGCVTAGRTLDEAQRSWRRRLFSESAMRESISEHGLAISWQRRRVSECRARRPAKVDQNE